MDKPMRDKRDRKEAVETSADVPGIGAVKKEAEAREVPTWIATKFLAKEILERIGYGLSSQQFINILLSLTGASNLIIGLVNGSKVVLSVFITFILERFFVARGVTRSIMRYSALLFAFSVFLLTMGIALKSIPLFIIAIFLGGILAVLYGNLYQDWFKETLQIEKRGYLLKKISFYGLIITGISMLAGAYLADQNISLEGKNALLDTILTHLPFQVKGYLIGFVLASTLFLIAAIVVFSIKDAPRNETEDDTKVVSEAIKTLEPKMLTKLLSNKVIIILLITSSVVSLVQTLGASFYGLQIYTEFSTTAYGGFLNVAIIFLIALLTSVVGPFITQYNSRAYGKFPMLVFGTLLMSFMPFAFYFKLNLLAIALATFISTIGSSICGVAYGLLITEMIQEEYKKPFIALSSVFTIIPYFIFIPVGAYIANIPLIGLNTLFLILGCTLIGVIMPLYFIVIILYNLKSEKI